MRRARRLAPLVTILALGAGGTPAAAQEYLPFDGLTRELRSLAGSSDRAQLTTIGESIQGREIWMVTLAAPGGPPVETRPGLLVVGNLEGDHLVGSALAVETVRYLLANQGSDDVSRLLAENVVYVVPRLNPDGAEAFFASVRWNRRTNARPWDDDNDGRTDEDGPDDLNGDGVITLMRVADPAGAFIPHPDEPRLMKRAEPAEGEDGAWTLYWEGRDDDGDGFYNEDGPGGVDLNRNFQHAYPYWEADAGPHMVSEPETRALMEFVIDHRNIAAVLTFGHTDNLVTPPDARGTLAAARALDLTAFADASFADIHSTGVFRGGGGGGGGFGFGGGGPRLRGAQPGRDNDPAAGQRPSTTVHRNDVDYFGAVSEAYREITGIEATGTHRAPEGAFFDFGYFQFGVPSFSTPGWAMPAPAEEEGERPARGARGGGPFDAQLLRGLEGSGVDAFVDWTPFTHPTLGAVEIGGFRPYVTTNPPAAMLGELGEAHGRFVARLGGMLPRVRIVDTEVTAHGGGIFTVEATVENTGYFPAALQHGMVARAVDPVLVQIQVDPTAIITGDDKSATIARLAGSGTRETVSWVIRGGAGDRVEIRLRAQKGGSDSATVTLGGGR